VYFTINAEVKFTFDDVRDLRVTVFVNVAFCAFIEPDFHSHEFFVETEHLTFQATTQVFDFGVVAK
jgi:hypothetical protein